MNNEGIINVRIKTGPSNNKPLTFEEINRILKKSNIRRNNTIFKNIN